jgi:cysteinyl-tRNA synthetase
MNITDVEDKIIRQSVVENKSIAEYTAIYVKAFLDDCAALRLERPERLARATEHIPEMAKAIQDLSAKGYTYQSDGSIYYRIAKFPEYGKLSHSDFSGMRSGARVDLDEYEKADARISFVEAPKTGSRFGIPSSPGRPGWHIECSVSHRISGRDAGHPRRGIDLVFSIMK